MLTESIIVKGMMTRLFIYLKPELSPQRIEGLFTFVNRMMQIKI